MPAASGSPTQLSTSCSTVLEIESVDTSQFRNGDVAYVAALSANFQLDLASTESRDGTTVLYVRGSNPLFRAPAGTPGRWILPRIAAGTRVDPEGGLVTTEGNYPIALTVLFPDIASMQAFNDPIVQSGIGAWVDDQIAPYVLMFDDGRTPNGQSIVQFAGSPNGRWIQQPGSKALQHGLYQYGLGQRAVANLLTDSSSGNPIAPIVLSLGEVPSPAARPIGVSGSSLSIACGALIRATAGGFAVNATIRLESKSLTRVPVSIGPIAIPAPPGNAAVGIIYSHDLAIEVAPFNEPIVKITFEIAPSGVLPNGNLIEILPSLGDFMQLAVLPTLPP